MLSIEFLASILLQSFISHSSSTIKTIAILGATGSIGRSIVRTLIDHPGREFQVIVLTHNPSGKRANELEGYNNKISIIQADTND